MTEDNEEERLRSVALQNAQSILFARRRAEEALRKQSEWLRVTLASIGDAVISTDAEGQVTFMNGVAESLTGWPQSEALGRPLPDVFHIINEQSRQLVESPALRALREDTVVGLTNHTLLITKDGTELPIDDSSAPIRNEQGEVSGVVLVFRDITERKRAEDRLRESEERATNIVESIADGLITLDKEWLVTYLNPRGEEILRALHKTNAAICGRNFWDEFPATVGTIIEENCRRSVREQMAIHFEVYYPPLEGWFDVRAYPSRDGLSLYFLDISERKQAEEQLRASEEFNRSVLESSPDCVKVLDLEGRLMMMNEPGLCLMEIDDFALFCGQQWWVLWPEESRPLVQQAIAEACAGGRGGFQGFAPTVKGTPKWWDVIVTPVRDADGRVTRLVSTSRDVTERKAIETERERLLAQEQQAREIAEAASRAKDEFLATVSHELRTPLNSILGWARLLSGGRLDNEAAARGLKSIERNAMAQAQLIEDLLDVSRIISGKFRLKAQPLEVAPVIEAAIDSVRPTADAKGISLQGILDPEAGPVSGDASRLQQVFWNLLSNAVKFTPRGGQVQVRLTRINSHIELEVSDTGQGIDHEFLPYVFDRFRQADGSTSRLYGGLGLGLAIVRHIVELHGGSVAVASQGKNQGATFIIRLPLMITHLKASQEERVHPKVNGEVALYFDPSSTLEGVKVLIVDDEPEALILLSTVLTQCDAHVRTATSAEEGFVQVKEWRPDVIVSDIGMPGVDGYKFMKRVRTWAQESGLWIPAIALTAYARTEDRMKALASGYQMHVAKPVEPAELIVVLMSLVKRQ